MRIKIISPAKTRESYILEGEDEYLKRLKADGQVEVLELDIRHSRSLSDDEAKRAEAKAISAKLGTREYLFILDERGKELSSIQFAELLQSERNMGNSNFTFIIGGPTGLDAELKSKASFALSLSKMTFPYQLTRLILLEQLYRALSIIGGKPYHK